MSVQRKTSLLVVDDNEASLYVKCRHLQRAGFLVHEARTGQEALQFAIEFKPALVLLDVHLPDMNGLDICRRIKSEPTLSSIFVLQITASLIDTQAKVEALNSGADSYLVEPVEPEELIATVRALLRTREAESARRKSEARYADLFAHASDMVFTLDPQGNFLTVNPAAERITGYTQQELLGRPFAEFLAPAELPRWQILLQPRPSPSIQSVDEIEIRAHAGRTVTLEINSWQIVEDSQIIGLQGIARDISERKRADELLRASEERLRRVLDSIVAFAAVLTPDGRILEVNRAALEIANLKMEQVRGLPFEESYWFNVTPELQQQIRESVRRAGQGELVRFDLRGRIASGAFIDIDYAIAPVYDAGGIIRYLIPSAVDISERKRTEMALRTIQQQQTELVALLESLLEHAPVGIAFFDRDLNSIRINRQFSKLCGASLSNPEGPETQAALTYLASTLLPNVEQVFETGTGIYNSPIQTFDSEESDPARSIRHLLASWYPVIVGEDQPRYVGTTLVDVTELRHYEQELQMLNTTLEQRVQERTAELERSNRELDQFAYVASHDLKAPLRAIANLGDWITEDAVDVLPPASQEHLRKLRSRILRMDQLLDDLLTYSRIGRRDGRAELVKTGELIQDVLALLAPADFQVQIAEPMPTLYTPRPPLELVFRNLIGNAIKHHDRPAQGWIYIQAQDLGEFVEFSVQDNGPGIDPRYHERIFGMFQTLRPRDEVEGSGMGLAVVKKTLEYRGGTVWVESAVGKGAIFRFTWPKE